MFAKVFYADKTGLVFKKGLRLNDILCRHVPKTNGFSISVVDKKSERYWRKLLVDDLKWVDGNDLGHDACVQYDLILCVASSIKSHKGVPYETVVAETLSAYVQNLSPSGVVILYVESNGEISASQSAIVFEELNKRLAKNEINATYYSERHYVLGETQHGMYVCVEPYSIRAILNRVAIYSGADERFFHNSLMYWNPIAKEFEEDGTEINVHVKRRDFDAQFEEAYRSMLKYYARLIDPTNGFLSGSISYCLEQLGYDVLVIKRNDIKDETINRIRQELLDFESNENHEDYTQPLVEEEDNSLSASYSKIKSKTKGYGNGRESLPLQLERACVALMVLLERIGAYLHGIYVAEMDMGTINKSKLLYMYFDVSRIEESSSHICFKESGFSHVTNYLMGLFLHRSQDKLIYYIQKSQVASVKAAIGSIMSRNGSHNIGSHVLAALSHNVGTLPDDRVLYQYIQQRMDYIATVTTDFPTWTQPTMFVADMMKTFLSQRHLLDHIVESEGLRAFQFQNPNMTDEEWAAQKSCVKIHIRRKIGEEYKEFIDYTKRDAKVSLQDGTEACDISLAIPGGIIGEHAFYTILENIIRNAAKHSWATGNNNAKNLDIYIDFTDEDEQVKFKVYTKLVESECKTLVKDLSKKLAQSFIDENTGALRRENWGMAEMKISAGYLAGESIEAIGGVGDKKGTNDIISPCIKSEKVKRKCVRSEKEVEDEVQYLGYEFFIAKPKEILIVVAEELKTNGEKDKWGNSTVRKELNKVGIFVKTVDEIKQEKRLNYRYVVHYDVNELFDENYQVKDGILLPFRVLSGAKIKKDKNRLNKFIPAISFADLKKCFESKGKTTIARKTDIERLVYKVYSAHLFRPQNNEKLGLLVAINENEKSGGNSLISDADILELMMEQNFAVCIDQYDALAQNENSRSTIKLLHSIKNSSNDDRNVVKFKYVQGRTIRELIAQRLYNWICNNSDINNDEICRHLKQKYYAIGKKEIDEARQDNDGGNNDDFARGVNALLSRHPIDDFIRYAESVFENTKKLFKQYEEQIVTLPAGYKVQSSDVGEGASLIDGIKIITSAEKKELEKEKDRHWIGYRRHAHTLPVDDPKRLYVEPLSGTQTYLSQLARVKTDLGLQMRLIENGLMRILVLDERVAKFLREHQREVGPHYKAMNINVIDDKWVEAGLNEDSAIDGFFSGYTKEVTEALKKYAQNVMTMSKKSEVKNDKEDPSIPEEIKNIFGDIDILIVHQGILDKWFTDLKSVEGMKHLLEGFKRLVKYVVVTTGRGTPENIPEEAHLLPFAVVESTLFKKYPEKLILTDTIMNVLPVGKKNDNSGGQE